MPIPCVLIDDEAHDGPFNMAVDEALLLQAAEAGTAFIRLYRWREPTLSLGYFQTYTDRRRHSPSADLAVVRRASGGGALVHHHEVTYSLTLPKRHPLCARPAEVVTLVHQTLADWVAGQLPQPAAAKLVRCPRAYDLPPAEQPFLCFQRRAEGDLLVDLAGEPARAYPCTFDGRFKVLGSAQRRHAGGLLQHGGLLLVASPHAPELPGLEELTGLRVPQAGLAKHWVPRLAETLQLAIQPAVELPTSIAECAATIAASKFAGEVWTLKR